MNHFVFNQALINSRVWLHTASCQTDKTKQKRNPINFDKGVTSYERITGPEHSVGTEAKVLEYLPSLVSRTIQNDSMQEPQTAVHKSS